MNLLPKKILIISAHKRSLLNFRGPLIQALVSRSIEVHLSAPDIEENGKFEVALETIGTTLHSAPLDRVSIGVFGDLRYFIHLWRLIADLKPDVVFAYNIKPVVYGIIAAWIARVPHRVALLAGLGFGFSRGGGFKQQMSRAVTRLLLGISLRRSSKVVFQNPDDKAALRNAGLLSSDHSTQVVSGSGIDLADFPPSDVDGRKVCYLMLSRLLVSKGVREYAAAAARIKRSYPGASFLLAGDIDINPDAISAEELHSWVDEGILEYLGRVEDVRPLLKRCTVYVLPSDYPEGIPRSILEALATGRAVVTTDTPGCRETVVHGVNGYLVAPRDVDSLQSALEEFCKQPRLAVEMGAKSLELARSRFDVNLVNADMLRALNL